MLAVVPKISASVIAPPKKANVYIVIKSYSGEEEGELDIEEGEELEWLSEESGWATVKRCKDGVTGFVPGTYLNPA